MEQADGRRHPVCLTCGHVIYRQLKVGAGVLVERDNELLLVQRGPETAFPGAWGLPAGYCEPDEPPSATAARETSEETGLQVRVGRLVDAYFFDDDPRGNGILLVYSAQVAGGELRGDGQETTSVGYFPPEGLPGPLCGGGHDQAIEAWRVRAADTWRPGMPMRYCPHCTQPLVEREAFDRVRVICPACGFVHFRSPKVGASVLAEYNGRVLLVKRAIEPGCGKWSLPSGFVEWDEAPEAAAVRECLEETGLVVDNLRLLEVAQYTDDFRGPGIDLTYQARVAGGHLRPGDDASTACFFAPAELPPVEQVAFHGHRVVLEHWKASHAF